MSDAGAVFDTLGKDEKISLLETLGFSEPQRYLEWDEVDLSYSCLFYEVQEELDKCFHRGEWRCPERETARPLKVRKRAL